MKLLNARFANEEETKSFYQFLKSKVSNKNEFTKDWLKTNGKFFIEIHSKFYKDFNNYKINLQRERYSERWNKWKENVFFFENRKKNIGRCVCGRSEGLYLIGKQEFIGCTNYKEQGYNHTKIYQPIYEPIYTEYEVELTSNYLDDLKKFYKLPKELTQNILADYLMLNGVDMLVNIEDRLSLTRNTSEKSKKRENLVKTFLQEKFIKLHHQKIIIAKFTDTKQTHFIPDFIGVTDKNIYLIEQKKNAELINKEQTDRYLLALDYIKKETKSEKQIKLIYLVEEGNNDLYNNILNFKNINDYEFN